MHFQELSAVLVACNDHIKTFGSKYAWIITLKQWRKNPRNLNISDVYTFCVDLEQKYCEKIKKYVISDIVLCM